MDAEDTAMQAGEGANLDKLVMSSAADDMAVGTCSSAEVCCSKTVPKETSPESKCPICLERFENVSYLDRCLHKFCFCCIREWAKNKMECPICKQPFYSILHSVQADDNYQELVLPPSENDSFGSPERHVPLNSHRNYLSLTVSPPDNGILFSYEYGSHTDSTIITISPDVGEVAERNADPSNMGVGTTHWDDETPGPSYSTLEPSPTLVSSLSGSSDEESSGAATEIDVKFDSGSTCEDISPAPVDDCLIVGFIKPLAERMNKERITKKGKGKKPIRSRDQCFLMRSQTESIASGNTKSRGRSRSQSRERGRSRSRRSDRHHPRDYRRNRDRSRHSERKNTWSDKNSRQGGQHPSERRRSRSRSSSQSRAMFSGTEWPRSEKPGGKRKCKTRHLDNEEGEGSQKAKNRKRKKSRSPSEEIINEGKATGIVQCPKKKNRKDRRHHQAHSANTSPVVIIIDSDHDRDHGENAQESVLPNTCTTAASQMEHNPRT